MLVRELKERGQAEAAAQWTVVPEIVIDESGTVQHDPVGIFSR